jgi:prevent-host-death family protein
MKPTRVTIHEAKTNLSRLIQKVASGEEVIIARGAKPVARLVAIEPPSAKRIPGSFKGKFGLGPDFFEPLPLKELDAWE